MALHLWGKSGLCNGNGDEFSHANLSQIRSTILNHISKCRVLESIKMPMLFWLFASIAVLFGLSIKPFPAPWPMPNQWNSPDNDAQNPQSTDYPQNRRNWWVVIQWGRARYWSPGEPIYAHFFIGRAVKCFTRKCYSNFELLRLLLTLWRFLKFNAFIIWSSFLNGFHGKSFGS